MSQRLSRGNTPHPHFHSAKYGYAGVADAVARIGGRTLLVEYKTGGVYAEHRLQLAAYAFAEFIGLADGREAVPPRIEGGLIVRVGFTGYGLSPISITGEDFAAFLHALSLYRRLGRAA